VCVAVEELHFVDGSSLTAQYLLVLDAINFCFWQGAPYSHHLYIGAASLSTSACHFQRLFEWTLTISTADNELEYEHIARGLKVALHHHENTAHRSDADLNFAL